MNKKIIARIEHLLNYPSDIGKDEVNKRIQEVELCFKELSPHLAEASLEDKNIFLKLLSQSNDLMKRAMDQYMKDLNLSPDKLKRIFEQARHSNAPEAQGLINALDHMQTQAESFKTTLARVNAKLSKEKGGVASPGQQRLKRSKWQKP